MTGNSRDEEFLRDLGECLKVADQLKDVDTDDTKMFVSSQLTQLHKFLQDKTRETENLIKKQITREVQEIENLKTRIARASDSKGNERDVTYAVLEDLWSVLKDDYWQAAYQAYLAETNDSVEDILKKLLAILQTSYKHCKLRAKKSRDEIIFQMLYPGEDSKTNKDLKLPKKLDENLESTCKRCQIHSTPFCLSSVQKAVTDDVIADNIVAKQFKTEQKPLRRALQNYTNECVKFCWIACLEEPELLLVTEPKKECSHLVDKFMDVERTTHRRRADAAIVVLPAVVQADQIRIPWELCSINVPRPTPDRERLPDYDYRVTKTEDRYGKEILDGSDALNDHEDGPGPTASSHAASQKETEDIMKQDRKTDNTENDVKAKAYKGPNVYTETKTTYNQQPRSIQF